MSRAMISISRLPALALIPFILILATRPVVLFAGKTKTAEPELLRVATVARSV